jgi:hypothetical protein
MLTYGHINGRNQPVVAAAARDMLDRPPCEARFASSDGAEFSQTDITSSMNRIALLILLTWAIPGHAANILNDPLIELVARAKKIERANEELSMIISQLQSLKAKADEAMMGRGDIRYLNKLILPEVLQCSENARNHSNLQLPAKSSSDR